MKPKYNLMLMLLLVLTFALNANAQESTRAAESAEKLRLQLLEVQGKEEALRLRAQQLDEDLKPENIERALAGIGSTKPEELRESRRRQLTIERKGVQTQLDLLATSRSRLETAIANADAKAYQESAQPIEKTTNQMLIANYPMSPRLLILALVGFLTFAIAAAAMVLRRRL
jgi:hypothetical protein